MIPAFDARGNLPPGNHLAAWQEIQERFGENEWRRTDFFQQDRDGYAKGIVEIDLETLP